MSSGGPEGKSVLIRLIDLVSLADRACERLDASWFGFLLGGLWRKKRRNRKS